MTYNTREEWLKAAVLAMAPLLDAQKAPMPEAWAVSMGFPKGGFKNTPSIGECWDPEVSASGVTNMFISPILGDSIDILATLLHEMVHAAVGLKEKHAGRFRIVARGLGLKGKLTATYAEPGTELHATLTGIAATLGTFPGTPMKPRKTPKKQGWFLVKLVSPNDPSYKFTIAPRLIEEYGLPKDYLGDPMEVVL